jgi:KaiC/GvpD/RAD55 family RecA-like ATPase
VNAAEARNGHNTATKRAQTGGCTLAAFAADRRLPLAFLERELAWNDGVHRGGPCIEMPYFMRNGVTRATRFRIALSGKDKFRQPQGVPLFAYEPDRGERAKRQRYVIIVEGESDTATLLHCDFPAIGLPGAGATKTLQIEHLEGLDHLFVVREPGDAGRKFVDGVRKQAVELGFRGSIHELSMPSGAKDPSELFVRDPVAFPGLLCGALEAAKLPPRPPYQSLSDMIAVSLRPVGSRLVTGFATLDDATRGGIPSSRVVVLAGAPGAGKSGLAVYLMDCWERSGCAVVYLASDEPAEGIITRLGQLAGYSREGLECEGEVGDSVRGGFAKSVADRSIVVIDPDADENMASIEQAEQALLHLAGARRRVLVVDSLQTARCGAASAAESARAAIDAKLGVLKAIAKRGTLVVAISEMSRAGYRSGARTENISALAAGKESGSIEYGAALLLGLCSVKGEPGAVDVEVAKNRLGGNKPEFRVQIDFARASFAEVCRPDNDQERMHGEENKAARLREKVLSVVAQHRELRSATAIVRKVKSGKQAVLDMVRELEEEGVLVKVGGAFRFVLNEADRT